MQQFDLRVTINGNPVSQAAIQANELERYHAAATLLVDRLNQQQDAIAVDRAAVSKVDQLNQDPHVSLAEIKAAVVDLKMKIGDEQMRRLLQADTQYMSNQYSKLPKPAHSYNQAHVVIGATGISMEEFFGWWAGRKTVNDERQMLIANPEHYLVATTQVNGSQGQELIETMGEFEKPMYYNLHFTNDPDNYPIPRNESYPKFMCVVGHDVATGKDAGITAFHQFKDENGHFKANLNLFFSTALPKELATGHVLHLAIEFSNWIRAAHNNDQN